jgi:hypothetical protein
MSLTTIDIEQDLRRDRDFLMAGVASEHTDMCFSHLFQALQVNPDAIMIAGDQTLNPQQRALALAEWANDLPVDDTVEEVE